MNNILKKVELKKFSSVFLTLSLLMQVGVLIPIQAFALPPVETIFEEVLSHQQILEIGFLMVGIRTQAVMVWGNQHTQMVLEVPQKY